MQAFRKDWDFLNLEFLSCDSNLQCAHGPPRLASTWHLLDLGGKGNQYHHEAHAIYSAVIRCFVSDPGVSSLLPAPMKLGLATRYLQEG